MSDGGPEESPRAADDPDMDISDVYLVTDRLSLVSASACEDAERQLGAPLPAGYADYMSRLGVGVYSGFVRVYPPERIVAEHRDVRERWREYFFWDAGEAVLPKARVLESVIIADTLHGDELIAHPSAPDRLLVLPRESDMIFHAGDDVPEAVRWLCESGELTAPIAERYFEAQSDVERTNFRGDAAFADVVAAIEALGLHDLVQVDEEEEFAEMFVRAIQGSIVIGYDGVGLMASITTRDGADAGCRNDIAACLAASGFVPAD